MFWQTFMAYLSNGAKKVGPPKDRYGKVAR